VVAIQLQLDIHPWFIDDDICGCVAKDLLDDRAEFSNTIIARGVNAVNVGKLDFM
jgi:hypothetical protein